MKRALLFMLLFVSVDGIPQNNINAIDRLFKHAVNIENENPLLAQSEALEVILLSRQQHYKKGLMLGNLFISESYVRSKDWEKALFYATEAEKNTAATDSYYMSKALRLKGLGLGQLGFYQTATTQLDKAVYYANKIKNENDKNRSLGFIYADFAINHEEKDQQEDSVKFFYEKSHTFFMKMGATNPHKNRCLAFSNVNLGSFYLKKRQFQKAETHLQFAAEHAKKLKLDFIKIQALSDLGSLHYYQEDYLAAKEYYLQALSEAKNKQRTFYINDLYYNLFRVYAELEVPDSSKYYRIQYIALNDSLANFHKRAVKTSLRLFLDEEQDHMQLSFKKLSFIIVICVLVILLSCIYIKINYKKFSKTLLKKWEIEKLLKEKRELIKQLKSRSKNKEADTKKIVQLAIEGSPLFFVKFKEMYPEFCDKITEKSPAIVYNELKFCALLKLRFSTKEIATYTKSTLKAVESKKYRLRKKLNIPSEVDLYEWIAEM